MSSPGYTSSSSTCQPHMANRDWSHFAILLSVLDGGWCSWQLLAARQSCMTAMILRSDKVSLPSLGPCSTTGIYVYESANDVSDSNQLTMTSDHVIPGSRVPTTRLSYWALSPRCLSSLKTISTMMPGSGACIVIVLTTPTSLKKTHTIHCRTSRDTYAFHAPPHKQLAALVERGVAYPPLGFIGMLGGCPGSNQEPETMAPLGIAK